MGIRSFRHCRALQEVSDAMNHDLRDSIYDNRGAMQYVYCSQGLWTQFSCGVSERLYIAYISMGWLGRRRLGWFFDIFLADE